MERKKKLFLKKIPAFNLQELLVVLVIIGILILMAMPSLMGVISKTKSLEAKNSLIQLYGLQQNHFFAYSRYSNDFDAINFIPTKTIKNGGNGNYEFEIIEVTNTSFKAQATAITDFDGDGIYNIWEIDHEKNLREVIKD